MNICRRFEHLSSLYSIVFVLEFDLTNIGHDLGSGGGGRGEGGIIYLIEMENRSRQQLKGLSLLDKCCNVVNNNNNSAQLSLCSAWLSWSIDIYLV